MAAKKKYVHKVVGPVAVVRTLDGSERYFYSGAIVPDGVDEASLKHVIAAGLVKKIEIAATEVEADAGSTDGADGAGAPAGAAE